MSTERKLYVDISGKYRVFIDSYNHTLQEFRPERVVNGKSVPSKWADIGYFPNMPQCVRRVIEIAALDGSVLDLEQYVSRLEALDKHYHKVLT